MRRCKGAIQQRRGLVRDGLALSIAAEDDIEVVATAVTGFDLVSICASRAVDVAVLEADATEWDPLAIARVLRSHHPRLRVVGTVAGGSAELTPARVAAGMTAVVAHEAGVSGLLAAVRGSCDADAAVAPRASTRLTRGLTGRQLEVLSLIGAGMSALEIAARLRISPKTVDNHKQRIYAKLGVQSQAHAVAVAIRAGLIGTSADGTGGVAS